MTAPDVLFPSQYTSNSSMYSLGSYSHLVTCDLLPLSFSPLPPSDSLEEHYSTNDKYSLPNETASASQDTRAVKSLSQDCKQKCKRSDVYYYFEKLMRTGEWMADKNDYCYTYKCWHGRVKPFGMGCHTSNMNKHWKICAG
ncbi:hypothetical protein O181_005937 [Austropuccinia psidii MF-1]|uniref:Uncharacterized protein n=1 Tax=Austropuccinia psidii MF-1 TaxID=1389203 RepID=A0A9Q3BJ25_9BASI|nr:hypothetical protein [Austropuccinia psidii MF-1]